MTQLFVGTVSKNVTEVACILAKRHKRGITLIPSRRQVDYDGGYVEGWTQTDLMKFIDDQRARQFVSVERDHAGPYQGSKAFGQHDMAMKDAIRSLHDDIDAGFDMLHLDPSVAPDGPSEELMQSWLLTLYRECIDYAIQQNKSVLFEIGGEVQTHEWSTESVRHVCRSLNMLHGAIEDPAWWPTYAVVQTGTQIVENFNKGTFQQSLEFARIGTQPALRALRPFGVHLKVHNADYLRVNVLRWMPAVGVHAVNIAPEYGYVETLRLIGALNSFGCYHERDEFLKIAYESGKWTKWMAQGASPSDEHCAKIAGHYVFSDPRIIELKAKVNQRFGVNLDHMVQRAIMSRMEEHGKALQWIN